MHARPKAARDGSAHPVRDGSSHTQYYHTVTAASSNRSPMTKVMDIFRNRSHASVPPEDRRKVCYILYSNRKGIYNFLFHFAVFCKIYYVIDLIKISFINYCIYICLLYLQYMYVGNMNILEF